MSKLAVRAAMLLIVVLVLGAAGCAFGGGGGGSVANPTAHPQASIMMGKWELDRCSGVGLPEDRPSSLVVDPSAVTMTIGASRHPATYSVTDDGIVELAGQWEGHGLRHLSSADNLALVYPSGAKCYFRRVQG
ncbi:MAG: hypothetical protein JSW71_05985 [Gemmatimonadota bacterium]|nr:MAG: hypothetical protein JSW71_05985 [Gemmatimonadota bacterium]